jgi:hypothetical protein
MGFLFRFLVPGFVVGDGFRTPTTFLGKENALGDAGATANLESEPELEREQEPGTI